MTLKPSNWNFKKKLLKITLNIHSTCLIAASYFKTWNEIIYNKVQKANFKHDNIRTFHLNNSIWISISIELWILWFDFVRIDLQVIHLWHANGIADIEDLFVNINIITKNFTQLYNSTGSIDFAND